MTLLFISIREQGGAHAITVALLTNAVLAGRLVAMTVAWQPVVLHSRCFVVVECYCVSAEVDLGPDLTDGQTDIESKLNPVQGVLISYVISFDCVTIYPFEQLSQFT